MYKKIFISLLILSPLFLSLLIGYPVQSYTPEIRGQDVYTRRCFKVGELKQFGECFRSKKSIAGLKLFRNLHQNLSSLHPFFDMVFFMGICGVVIGVLVL